MNFKTMWFVLGIACAAGCGAESIGTLQRFWRYHPVLDRWMVSGAGLQEIPDWLCDPELSFPYRKKEFSKEIPFADHVTAVRVLGGWEPNWKNGEVRSGTPSVNYDLAYRDEAGNIRYRWPLLFARLDPYVDAGCGLTVVLDNTPACFCRNPSWKSMGQAAPPDDLEEWGAFIEELCRQLVGYYGFDAVNSWRFRLGTECQGDERFDGTQEQFHQFYDATASAVRRVLPDAPFGPYNLAGSPNGENGTLSYMELAAYCVSNSLPLDFAAVSIYSAPSVLRGILRTTNPRFKAQQKVEFWDALAALDDSFKGCSREVQEFGIMENEFKVGYGEPGARGAAWYFDMMMTLLEGGMDRFWVWDVFDFIPHSRRDYLLNGVGWLLSVLEESAGGEVSILKPQVIAKSGAPLPAVLQEVEAFERDEPLLNPGRLFTPSLMVEQRDRMFLLTSMFHEDRFVCTPHTVTLEIPDLWGGNIPAVQQTMLARTNSVHWLVRQSIDRAGLLKPEFSAVPGQLGQVIRMGGHAARLHVGREWPKYERCMKDLLILKPFDGDVQRKDGRVQISFEAAPPSIMVIVIQKPVPAEKL